MTDTTAKDMTGLSTKILIYTGTVPFTNPLMIFMCLAQMGKFLPLLVINSVQTDRRFTLQW